MSASTFDLRRPEAGWTHLSPEDRTRLERRELVLNQTTTTADRGDVQLEAVFDCAPPQAWQLITNFESLPEAVYGLDEARVLSRDPRGAVVQFRMKLPFPVGVLSWVNRVELWSRGDHYTAAWTLLEGDLARNEGRIEMTPYDGGTGGTHARYRVQVAMQSKLPKRAQRMATRWLLPRVVARLRSKAEA